MGQAAPGGQPRQVGDRGARPRRQDHRARRQLQRPFLSLDLHPVGRHEARAAADQREPGLGLEGGGLVVAQGVAPSAHLGQDLGRGVAPGRRPRCQAAGPQPRGRVEQGLGGDAAGVGAVAAHLGGLDQGHPPTDPSEPDRHRQPARARAHHDGVEARRRR
jgi:hypothetical protein